MRKNIATIIICAMGLAMFSFSVGSYSFSQNGTINAGGKTIGKAYMLPSAGSQEVFYVDKNDKVEVFCKDGNFYLLMYPFNNTGKHVIAYVPDNLVDLSGTVKNSNEFYQNKNGKTKKQLELRHNPTEDDLIGATKNNKVRATLQKDADVTILFEKDSYYFIKSGSVTGFMMKNDFSEPAPIATPAPVATPTPTPEPTPVATPTPTPEPTPVATPTPTPEPTPTPTPTPTPNPEVERIAYVTGTGRDNLNVRSGAGTNFSVIGKFSANSTITVVGEQTNNFYKVKYDGGYGYSSAKYISFTKESGLKSPRDTAPATDNTYYYSNNNIFYASKFSPPFSYGGKPILGNCTWYAWGRAYEIVGSKPGGNMTGNAHTWWNSNINSGKYKYGQQAKVGAIAVWKSTTPYTGGCGHVAVVERIENGKIYISESAWQNTKFKYREIYNTNYLLGYIYILD